jgi:hypothetical protein
MFIAGWVWPVLAGIGLIAVLAALELLSVAICRYGGKRRDHRAVCRGEARGVTASWTRQLAADRNAWDLWDLERLPEP